MTDERHATTADLAEGMDADDSDRELSRDDADRQPKGAATATEERLEPLMPESDADGYRSRWQELQASFVDEPQRVVEQADELVAELMQRLAQSFADERKNLEEQWGRGDDVSTEDLRVALTRYRSFFERLLST
jgi:hypothetical protein